MKEEVRDPNKYYFDDTYEKMTKENNDKLLEAKKKLFDEKGCFFVINNNEFKDEYFGKLVIDNFETIDMHEK